MELLSPKELVFPGRILIGHSEYPIQYDETGMGITQNGRLSKVFFGTEVWEKGTTAQINIEHYPPSQETMVAFIQIQRLVNTCVNNAEDIKRQLHDIVPFILKGKPDLQKASATYDFMKLKDTLTDYMKKDDKTRHLANKAFRKSFNQFVIDRNTYTHGKLVIRHPDDAFVIEYQNNSTKITAYALVDIEIIQSYYSAYKTIRAMLHEFHELAIAAPKA